MYSLTDSEIAIKNAFTWLQIDTPVNLQAICDAVGIRVRYRDAESASYSERHRIVLDVNQDRMTQREDWAHELAHVLLHCGSQLLLPDLFLDLQERQANVLALFLLVPSHLLLPFLEDLRPQTETQFTAAIAQHFEVSADFAKRRWRKLQAQLEGARQEQELMAVLESSPQYGRDYDSRLTIGHTEYFYRNGGVVFQRRVPQE